jgi:DNA primase catalytic core
MAPEAEHARAYVAGRGLDMATIDAFKLGFAPDSWDALLRELDANGVARETAEAAGLLRQGQSGFYDFYRNRLMIPTYATTGEAVAFGGRSLDGREPKYLNTSTTPVYTKGRGLYALNVARRAAAAKDGLVVVEGYLDCIALHQGGFANAVASLGTAFTAQQAAELRKYAERIFLCFDADAAGTNATVKSIDVLNDAGCAPFIVQLPPGEDPDTFIRTHGAAAFQTRLDNALPWIQFKLDRDIAEILRMRLPRAQAAARAEALVRHRARASPRRVTWPRRPNRLPSNARCSRRSWMSPRSSRTITIASVTDSFATRATPRFSKPSGHNSPRSRRRPTCTPRSRATRKPSKSSSRY